MNGVKLYRKRLIPEECILLKDDHLFYQSPDILMTAWSALKPKPDLDHGISCYYLKEGFKISKFYDHQNRFMYWYCDIISHQYDKEENRYIFTDLLADVILYPTIACASLIWMNFRWRSPAGCCKKRTSAMHC